MMRIAYVLGLLGWLLALALPVRAAESITVAVAANVKPTFRELEAAFVENTGIRIKEVVGSSGKITAQIKAGAPYDVFLSADTEYPQSLSSEGYAASEPRIYAYGTLVLWTLNDLPIDRGVPLLAEAGVHRIAIANPKVAPYGREAVRALAHYGIEGTVTPKLVYAESVAQAAQYVESKSTDAGFIAKSIVLAPELQGKGTWVEVPRRAYQPIAQAAVILRHGAATNPIAAQKFLDFLFTDKARAIFSRYGYILP